MPIDNGGPAFPRPASIDPTSGTLPEGDRLVNDQAGLSLRDYFAAAALPTMCVGMYKLPYTAAECEAKAAVAAYAIADAMLAQRTKG